MADNSHRVPALVLPVIIYSQFAGTSLWFAGNAVILDLQRDLNLPINSVGTVTSAVQFGFIAGTLIFAFLSLSDRFSPIRVFLVNACLGSLANAGILLWAYDLPSLLVLRFFTGFFLAGIYPVGMQIAASWYKKGLGRAIGYLVGALVLGTAFPHLVKTIGADLSWQSILIYISILAFSGGVFMWIFVPIGPYRKRGATFKPLAILDIFKIKEFRAAAFGYFGHMWELYAFWAFVPVYLMAIAENWPEKQISLWTFLIIAAGFFGCVVGGILSQKVGSAKIAFVQLLLSGSFCALSPFLHYLPLPVLLFILLLWGGFVVGDSPQFSTLVARKAPEKWVGTSLTIVNSIGFLITIPSIQLLSYLYPEIHKLLLLPLCIGPIFGLISLYPLIKT